MRRPDIAELAGASFDVVIIGGGITGAATARDAALRGLSVLLVEKDDFAAGTSSRSSKLIHGGLRYLQTYQFGLVAESLQERERMLTLAPHLTEVRPFLYLLYRGYPESMRLLNLGLTFYDAASGQWRKRRHRMLSPGQVLEREPHIEPIGLVGAGQYYDVLTDDARLTVDTAKSAAESGACLLNHARAVGLVVEKGQARGVRVRDEVSGVEVEVGCRQVLNASGPWSDEVRRLEVGAADARVRPAKGVHIVVRKADFPLNTAVFLRSPDDNRVVWPTPSLEEDLVYIGTTDTDDDGDPDDVVPDERDVRYLLNVANTLIPAARLSERHVVGSWAGLRPLAAADPNASTGNTSREHVISTGPTGMLTITGGKLTSARVMAKHLVDAAIAAGGLRAGKDRAAKTRLSGGSSERMAGLAASATATGVPREVWQTWSKRYGSNAGRILDFWRADEAAREVVGPRHLTRAEVRYCVREEMCQGLADLLVRRTSLFFWDAAASGDAAPGLAAELAAELGWDEKRVRAEVASYRTLVQRHLPS